MKRSVSFRERMLLCAVIVFVFSFSASAKGGFVQRGMTKDQVTSILGKPDAMSFNESGEVWTYKKVPLIGVSENKLIYVNFGKDNSVISYHEYLFDYDQNGRPVMTTPQLMLPGYQGSYGNYPQPYELSEGDFSLLYGKVKKASFTDNKCDLLQMACLGCWFTCRQAARLLILFSFDDDKLRALHLMAPRLVDLGYANEIYDVFTFSSNREKASEIIAGAQSMN